MLLAKSNSLVTPSYFTNKGEQTILAQKALCGVFAFCVLNALFMKNSRILKSEQFLFFFFSGNTEVVVE